MRVALSATAGILSALAPLMIKETCFLLSENRQASERHELAHNSICPNVTRPEPEIADLHRVPVSLWFGYRRDCDACSRGAPWLLYLSRVEPEALRVRRVRMNHDEDSRIEGVNVANRVPGERGTRSK